MMGERDDEPIEDRYRELTELFERAPLAYAGYRIAELEDRNSDISEADEIPFITTPLFPLAIVGYVLFARATHVVRRILGRSNRNVTGGNGHVFSMTSDHSYRSFSFLELARALSDRGDDVILLCSPAAEKSRESWEGDGLSTVTHRELHGRVPAAAVGQAVFRSAVLTVRLLRTEDVRWSVSGVVRYYNFILLEHVKRESIDPITRDDPAIHTFSAMPYLLDATASDRIFVYQHGLQMANYDMRMSMPFFAPLRLLIWGETWREHFERSVHSGSTIEVVGSPWYDHLAEKAAADRDIRHDVLLIGGSHGLTDDAVAAEYEQMVDAAVDICERNGFDLAVKLHPLESAEWYEKRGWGEYVAEFDDIDEALLGARVSVTNSSTAFIESATLGVPVVVADLPGKGLSGLAPVANVRFTDGPEVADGLRAALDDSHALADDDSRSLVRVGGSLGRILSVIDGRSSGSRPKSGV